MRLLPKISTLAELRALALTSPRYRELLKKAALNLGGRETDDVDANHRWLVTNANETASEAGGGEAGVVREVNDLRRLL